MPNTPKIVTRSNTTSTNTTENLGKGSKLTFAEMDSNFIELKNGSIGIVGDDSTGIDIAQGSTLKVAGTGGIATTVSGDTLTVDASSIVTSSLGDLTAVGSTLISPSNADITLDPAGTGSVSINADLSMPAIEIHDNNIKATRTNDDLVLETNNTGSIILRGNIQAGDDAASGLNNTTITGGDNQSVALIGGSTGGTVKVMPGAGNGTGEVGDIYLTPGSSTAEVIVGDGSNQAIISSNSTQDLVLRTNDGGTEPYIQLEDGANGDINITPHNGGDGKVVIGNDVSAGGGGLVQVASINFNDPTGISNAGRTTFDAIHIPFTPDGSTSNDFRIGLDSNGDPFISFNNASTDAGAGAKIKTNTGNLILQSGSERIELAANTVQIGNNTIVVSGNRMFTDASNEDLELDANGTGNVSALAQLNMNSNKIVNVTDPTSAQDAATKAYVDANQGTGDLTFTGSTITAPSNADLTLTVAGTGQIVVDGTLTATEVISDLTGTIEFDAKATEAISKGEAVYIAGIDGNTPTVALARANAAGTMPGFGIAAADIALNATGKITTFGSLTGLDVTDFGETSITFALGDTVYISSAEAGKLTNVAPTGEANFIQNIGKIERHSPTNNITIKVGGAGRSNATPALNDGNIFIGNASNQAVTTSLQTQVEAYSINNVSEDTSPQLGGNLDLNSNNITGTGNISTTGTLSLTNTTTDDSLLITTTEDSSTAAPVITLKRNSASPANGDYLGQVKFKGENDADQEVVYAKITGKISDNTDTTEDGLIEFALRKAGSNNIGARLTSTELKLINGTGLEVAGLTYPTADGTADQVLGTNGSGVLSFRDPTAINIDGGVADSVYTSVPTIDGGTA